MTEPAKRADSQERRQESPGTSGVGELLSRGVRAASRELGLEERFGLKPGTDFSGGGR